MQKRSALCSIENKSDGKCIYKINTRMISFKSTCPLSHILQFPIFLGKPLSMMRQGIYFYYSMIIINEQCLRVKGQAAAHITVTGYYSRARFVVKPEGFSTIFLNKPEEEPERVEEPDGVTRRKERWVT